MGGRCAGVVRCVVVVMVGAGLVAGLSGCSGVQGVSGSGAGPSSASSSASPTGGRSPSGSATATLDDAARARIPKAARAHTAKGAEAFARFYLEQVNRAWMRPDPDLIRPYALKSCKTCANYVKTAASLQSDGRRYESAPSLVGPSILMPESSTHNVVVHIGQVQLAARILRQDGSLDRTLSKVPGEVEVQLRYSAASWRIGEIRGLVK